MGKSRSRRAISKKSRKISKKTAKKPVKKTAKEIKDLLPPPPPELFKKPSGFTPSAHDLHKLVSNLKRDVLYIMDNEKFLEKSDKELMGLATPKIIKILDVLKNEKKYVDEVKEIEKKIENYEKMPNKGWLTSRKIEQARALLDIYKPKSSDARKKIIQRFEIIRKQKELTQLKGRVDEETAKKHEIIESLEKPAKAKPEPKPLIKQIPLPPKAEQKQIPPPPEQSSHELKKHVFGLKKSLDHVTRQEKLLKHIEDKIHTFSHKDLHETLGKLDETKEHLDKIEETKAHVEALSETPQKWHAKSKLDIAKRLLHLHGIDTKRAKADIAKKKQLVRKHISRVEKESKEEVKKKKIIGDMKTKVREEKAELVPKASELKKYISFVAKNKPLLELTIKQINMIPLKKVGKTLDTLKELRQTLDLIEDIEDHFVAHKSKPDSVTAEKHLDDARELMDVYGINIDADRKIADEKIAAVKKRSKELEEKFKHRDVAKKEEKEYLPLLAQVRKEIDYAKTAKKLLKVPDEKLNLMSNWKLNRLNKKLNFLKKHLDSIEDIEDHFVAESSKPKNVSAADYLDSTRRMLTDYGVELHKDMDAVNKRIKLVAGVLKEKAKPVKVVKPVKEKLVKELPKPVPEAKPAELPKIEEVPKFEKRGKLEIPPLPTLDRPSDELVMLTARLKKDLAYVSKLKGALDISDEGIASLNPRKAKKYIKQLQLLGGYLDSISNIEEHVAAEKSVAKTPTVENQLEMISSMLERCPVTPHKAIKNVDHKLKLLGSTMEEEIPKPKMPKAKPLLEKPSVAVPKITIKLSPEIKKLAAKLKSRLAYLRKLEKVIAVPSETVAKAGWLGTKLFDKHLVQIREAIVDVENVDEELAARLSVVKDKSVEEQLGAVKALIDISKEDLSKSKKLVKEKLEVLEAKKAKAIKPLPEAVPAPAGAKPLPELKPAPELKPLPEFPEIEKPSELEVPKFEPSISEINNAVSQLKSDIAFIKKHERLLHIPDHKLLRMPNTKFEQILCELKKDQAYVDDLERIERLVAMYEEIPGKSKRVEDKTNAARELLGDYKSDNISVMRNMIISRIDLMRARKEEAEKGFADKRISLKEAVEDRRAIMRDDAAKIKELEAHISEREKSLFEEKASDIKDIGRLKAAEKKRMFEGIKAEKPEKVEFREPEAHPVMARDQAIARAEITRAIEQARERQPENKIQFILGKIEQGSRALEELDINSAKQIYLQIHQVYLEMKPLEQYRVYEALRGFYEERKTAEKLVG